MEQRERRELAEHFAGEAGGVRGERPAREYMQRTGGAGAQARVRCSARRCRSAGKSASGSTGCSPEVQERRQREGGLADAL